ncbi:hypothetical protein V1511DRAFT_164001 [Dipodascopsis uninucleata]
MDGKLHKYEERLAAFEFTSSAKHESLLLFIGGLGDGLLTVPYVVPLSKALDQIGWSVAQVLISSSYTGWGSGSLKRDADELSKAIDYFSEIYDKIVLMGHSTGCQDTMYYLTVHQHEHPTHKLAGAILQAPVSDREAMMHLFPDSYGELLDFALDQARKGKGNNYLPPEYSALFFNTPITVDRWVSLANPLGDDDFFSSDLPDTVLWASFGHLKVPTLILYSGSEEFAPVTIDKQALLERWKSFVPSENWSAYSGIIPGASHNLTSKTDGDKPMNEAISKVIQFIRSLP